MSCQADFAGTTVGVAGNCARLLDGGMQLAQRKCVHFGKGKTSPDFVLKNVKILYISSYQRDSVLVFCKIGGANFLEKKPK